MPILPAVESQALRFFDELFVQRSAASNMLRQKIIPQAEHRDIIHDIFAVEDFVTAEGKPLRELLGEDVPQHIHDTVQLLDEKFKQYEAALDPKKYVKQLISLTDNAWQGKQIYIDEAEHLSKTTLASYARQGSKHSGDVAFLKLQNRPMYSLDIRNELDALETLSPTMDAAEQASRLEKAIALHHHKYLWETPTLFRAQELRHEMLNEPMDLLSKQELKIFHKFEEKLRQATIAFEQHNHTKAVEEAHTMLGLAIPPEIPALHSEKKHWLSSASGTLKSVITPVAGLVDMPIAIGKNAINRMKNLGAGKAKQALAPEVEELQNLIKDSALLEHVKAAPKRVNHPEFLHTHRMPMMPDHIQDELTALRQLAPAATEAEQADRMRQAIALHHRQYLANEPGLFEAHTKHAIFSHTADFESLTKKEAGIFRSFGEKLNKALIGFEQKNHPQAVRDAWATLGMDPAALGEIGTLHTSAPTKAGKLWNAGREVVGNVVDNHMAKVDVVRAKDRLRVAENRVRVVRTADRAATSVSEGASQAYDWSKDRAKQAQGWVERKAQSAGNLLTEKWEDFNASRGSGNSTRKTGGEWNKQHKNAALAVGGLFGAGAVVDYAVKEGGKKMVPMGLPADTGYSQVARLQKTGYQPRSINQFTSQSSPAQEGWVAGMQTGTPGDGFIKK